MPKQLHLSSAWEVTPTRRGVSLVRRHVGTQLRIDGESGRALTSLLSKAFTRPDARRALGDDAGEILEALTSHGAIREFYRTPLYLRGNGPAESAVREVHKTGLPLHPIRLDDTLSKGLTREVQLGVWGRTLFALRNWRPCGRCMWLRLLGKQPPGSREPQPPAPALEGVALRNAVAEALEELGRGPPLLHGDVVMVAPNQPAMRAAFLRHPDCETCSPSVDEKSWHEAFSAALARKENPADRAHRMRFLDPTFGPLELNELEAAPGKYPLDLPFIWGSVSLARSVGGRTASSSTFGGIYATADRPELLRQIALSEGLERLAARSARPHVVAKPSDPRGVDPRSLYSFAESGGPERPFCFARDLHTGQRKRVPFECVVVGLAPELDPDAWRHEAFYTGTASHTSLTRALLHATLELLGRDALVISWYRRRSLPRLAWPKELSRLIEGRARYLKERGFRLDLFDLRLDVALPTVLLKITATRRRGNWPRAGSMLVASAAFTAEEALEGALKNATSQVVNIAEHPAPFKDPLDARAVRAFAKKAAFWPLLARYLDPKYASALEFLDGGGELQPFESLRSRKARSPAAQLRALGKALEKAGLPWLATRLTDADAERAGFEIVKVVIPGLLLAQPTRAAMDFGLPRLWRDWPGARGSSPNPDPHPLC